MIEYRSKGAGFCIRIEHHGGRKLMRIDAFGRWNRAVADAFQAQAEQLCLALSGQPWGAIWEAHGFPAQKPYILASLERVRREAVRYGMSAAAVLDDRDGQQPRPPSPARFDNEHEAIAYTLARV